MLQVPKLILSPSPVLIHTYDFTWINLRNYSLSYLLQRICSYARETNSLLYSCHRQQGIIAQRQKGYPTISDWIRDVCCPGAVSGSCWIQGTNRLNIKGTGARGFLEQGMMVSPKLVPLNSLHSCHWKVPGSLLSLWERRQLFKSKDLAAWNQRKLPNWANW